MAESIGAELRRKVTEDGLVDLPNWGVEGCTDEEIEHLKEYQGVEYIPETYRQFLLSMGKGAGILFRGSDYHYNLLKDMKKSAAWLLEDNDTNLTLPDDTFVFMMHQGYSFLFFHTKDREYDPAVYMYVEGKSNFSLTHQKISEFFEEAVQNLARLRNKKS